MQYKTHSINQWVKLNVDVGDFVAKKVIKITKADKNASLKQKGVAVTSGKITQSKELIMG